MILLFVNSLCYVYNLLLIFLIPYLVLNFSNRNSIKVTVMIVFE